MHRTYDLMCGSLLCNVAALISNVFFPQGPCVLLVECCLLPPCPLDVCLLFRYTDRARFKVKPLLCIREGQIPYFTTGVPIPQHRLFMVLCVILLITLLIALHHLHFRRSGPGKEDPQPGPLVFKQCVRAGASNSKVDPVAIVRGPGGSHRLAVAVGVDGVTGWRGCSRGHVSVDDGSCLESCTVLKLLAQIGVPGTGWVRTSCQNSASLFLESVGALSKQCVHYMSGHWYS